MAQQISVEITINGKPITPFAQLTLRQQFNGHHYFELRFNHDVVEAKNAMTLDKSKDFLGKNISISFNKFNKTGTENVFKGIVTEIGFLNNSASLGDLVFKGYSPTIMLETGETNLSHLKRSLSQIVKDTIGAIPSNDLSTKIAPVKSTVLPYTTQYRESNFSFLRRLAAEYGEWFFYDGGNLNFGKPSGGATLSLQYPNDISDLNLQVRLAPASFEEISYLSKENKPLNGASSSQQVAGLDAFGKHALNTSNTVFSTKSSTLSRRKFLEAAELNDSVKTAMATNAAQMVVLQAITDNPGIKLGGTIQVMADTTDYGNFTVISVNHFTDGHGNYQNEIEAIPSSVAVVPNPHYLKPIAEPQTAIVTNNEDPDKLGKVKVKMLWQKDPATTPYIRVMTPDGGGYKDDNKPPTAQPSRGYFFTPEVGDYVIVGFNQNDPDRPFVMGSLQHGKAIDSAENEKNNVKSISTRNGSTIYFHDKAFDDQEIMVQTDKDNYISITLSNGGNDGTIKIYSTKLLEVNSKEGITINATKNIDIQGDKTISIKSEKISIEATDSITMKANKNIEIDGLDIKINANKGVEINATADAKIGGLNVSISAQMAAKLAGNAQAEISASGITSVKGSMVMIN